MLFIWCLTASFQERSNKDQIRRERLLHNVDIYAPILDELQLLIKRLQIFEGRIEATSIKAIYQKSPWFQIDEDFIGKFNELEPLLKNYCDHWSKCFQLCDNLFKKELVRYNIKRRKQKKNVQVRGSVSVSSLGEVFPEIINSKIENLKKLLSRNLNDIQENNIMFLAETYTMSKKEFIKKGEVVYKKFQTSIEFEEIKTIQSKLLDFLHQLQKELGEAVREPWKVLYE